MELAMSTNFQVLPKDLMELQLGQIDLLMAMYESDGAIFMDGESTSIMQKMRSWCESDEDKPPNTGDAAISLLLNVRLDSHEEDPSTRYSLGLDLSIPTVFCTKSGAEDEYPTEPPKIKCRIRKPTWMNKAQAVRVSGVIQDEEEDVLGVIENVKEAASNLLSELLLENDDIAGASVKTDDQPLVRVWFYFPSISTRAKRDDLINHGPAYGLTGFLLAGKPGILCLEGGSQSIDEYMKFIKTESWGDIPPQHKKVSERHREITPGVTRLFQDMQEITALVGERRGERANRSDMKALEAWLEAHGISPDVFGKVFF